MIRSIQYIKRCSLGNKEHFILFPNFVNFGSYLKFINFPDFGKIYGTSEDDVTKDLNLSDKTCLITGANGSIGLELTKCLSARECNVLMACRNTYTANVARNSCENKNRLYIYELNLASLKSVKQCADEIIRKNKKIDIVILNAAVFGLPWTLTEDGLETIFQVNFISQYYLLMTIEKILAPDARVVFMSSESHRKVNWNVFDMMAPTEDQLSLPKDKYTSIKAYNITKLCGLLAMHYMTYRWHHQGRAVFSVHPGSFVRTGLCRNWWVYEALYAGFTPFTKSIHEAAKTPFYCATSPDLNGLSGIYFKDFKPHNESDLAKDSHLSFRIMDLTCQIISDRVPVIGVNKETEDVRYEVPAKEEMKHFNENVISTYST